MLTCHVDFEIFQDADLKYHENTRKKSRFFLDFFSKESDVIIYNVDDCDEAKYDIISEYLEERGETSTLNRSKNILSTDAYDKNKPYQVFFFNEKNIGHQEKIKSKIPLLVGFITNYEQTINLIGDFITRTVHYDSRKNEFQNYGSLFLNLPITELVISDSYLLKSFDDNPLENNYYSFLEFIKANFPEIQSIIIFSYVDEEREPKSNEKLIIGKRGSKSNEKLIIEKSLGILGDQIKFRLVTFYGRKTPHSRYIFTNYYFTKPGVSLNRLYDANDEISIDKSDEIEIWPYSKLAFFDKASKILKDLQRKLELSNNRTENEKCQNISTQLFITKP